MLTTYRLLPARTRCLVTSAAIAILAACSTNTGLVSERWVIGEPAPCERLVVGWPVRMELLQDIVGANVTPRDEDADGEGELRLSILRCAAPVSSASPTLLAQVTIPLASDSVPIMVSGVARDGWSSLPLTVVDRGSARRLAISESFSWHGYAVMDADLAFDAVSSGDGMLVTAELRFEAGRIAVFATARGEADSHETTSALIGTGIDDYTMLFGGETARRHSSVRAAVRIEGSTVLSDLNLAETPATAVFDTELASDRVFWRESLVPE